MERRKVDDDKVPWQRDRQAAEEATGLKDDFTREFNLPAVVALRPAANEPAEVEEKGQYDSDVNVSPISTEELERSLHDQLYSLASQFRALTWEQMEEFAQGSEAKPAKVIAWAKAKMGDPEIIEPAPKSTGRRV